MLKIRAHSLAGFHGGHESNVGSSVSSAATQGGERRGQRYIHPDSLVVMVVAVTACETDSEQNFRPGRKDNEFHPGWVAAA